MAKAAGRLAVMSKGGTALAGVKMTSIKFSAVPIDVTDYDSTGIITLLSGANKSQQLVMTVEGIHTSVTLRAIALDTAASKMLTDLTFKHADALAAADTITGNFYFSDYEEGNPEDDATTFKATFTSSGAWTVG